MKAEQVIDHFDRICDAPDAIPRLRRFILDLAVRGKLVESCPHDGSGSILLDIVRTLKEELSRERRLRNEEVDYSGHTPECNIPATWVWAYVSDVALVQGGKRLPAGASFSPKSTPHIYIRVRDMKNGTIIADELRYIAADVQRSIAKYTINKEDLYITIAGTIGQVGRVPPIFDGQNLTENAAKVVFRGIDPDFFCMALNCDLVQQQFRHKTNQVAQPKLALKRILGTRFPLPPLAEQHRIVSKVDELMALCDRLEAAQRERERRRDKLAASSLNRLNNNANADEFREHTRFHLHHLPRLTTRREHIQQLRQAILNLAIRGKLVPQDLNDEPGSELLKKIQMEKERLIRQGLIRKEKPLSPVAEEVAPFSIPRNWSWVRIGTCALLTDYGTSVKSDHIDNGVPVLKMGDIRDGNVLMGGQKKVPPSIDDLPQLFLKRFDLLYNRTNSAELVGKTGIYLGEDDAYTFASYLIRIRFFNDQMSPVYCNLAMNASYFRATQIVPELQQQCGQANVNGTKLRNMVLPLPPAAEQNRIIAKVDELMAECDRLEAQLGKIQTTSRSFLEAILHEAVSGSIL